MDLTAVGRRRFLEILATEYGPDRAAVDDAIERAAAAADDDERDAAEVALRVALTSPRTMLLAQLTSLTDGVKLVVDMRAELRRLAAIDRRFIPFDREARELLAGWFDVGFIDLMQITWDRTPALILEKLIEYEAVHEIKSWADMKQRLGPDRRLYGFFHPRMPEEPLIFVEVALVSGMARSITDVIGAKAAGTDPAEADTAIFYSISNCQEGLAGVSFGDFLIKRVVAELARDLPQLQYFATLSPLPGFRRWLERTIADEPDDLVDAQDAQALEDATGESRPARAMAQLLREPHWHTDDGTSKTLRDPILKLATRYLTEEKRSDTDHRTLDPVAHFHLSNGARVERLNWMGNPDSAGLAESLGLMVNYRYDLEHIERNHERYVSRGLVAARSELASGD